MQRLLWVVLGWGLILGGRAVAEPPLPASRFSGFSLGLLCRTEERITVVRVVRVVPGTRTLIYRTLADLKGKRHVGEIRHSFHGSMPAADWQRVSEWAQPGATAIVFETETESHICLGNIWFYGVESGGTTLIDPRSNFAHLHDQAYVGSVEKLRQAVTAILAGKEATVTVPAPESLGAGREDSPIPRDWLWGKKGRVCRVRAGRELVTRADIEKRGSAYFVGWGSGGREAVADLVAALCHKDPRIRAEAAVDLGQLDPPARDALPALQAALRDPEGRVRVFAAEALARIDPTNEHSIPALRAALKDREPDTRHAAAVALAEGGPVGRPALSALVSALGEEREATMRAVIACALGRIGPDSRRSDCTCRDMILVLGRALRKDADADVRFWSVPALMKFGPEAKVALPDLAAALKDGDERLVWWATDLAARLGREGTAVLIGALEEKSDWVRRCAARRLADLGPHSKAIVPALRKALADEDREVREWAVQGLLRIDHELGVKEGVPVLACLLADATYERRREIVATLADLRSEARSAVPTLIDVLREKPSDVRRDVVWALGRIGPEARAAVPPLLKIVRKGKSATRRCAAGEALVRIAPEAEETRAALKALFENRETSVRLRAAALLLRLGDRSAAATVVRETTWDENNLRDLGELGPHAAVLLPTLTGALRKSTNTLERAMLALAVWRIGREVKCGEFAFDQRREAIDVLVQVIGDRQAPAHLRDLVVVESVVSELRARAAPLAPALAAVLENGSAEDREMALGCLAWMGRGALSAAPLLERALKTNRDPEQRTALAVALTRLGKGRATVPVLVEALEKDLDASLLGPLGALGAEAKPAVPSLLRALRCPDREMYLAAAAALFRIDRAAAARVGIFDAPPRDAFREASAVNLDLDED
jgi:HEAT repeat protein